MLCEDIDKLGWLGDVVEVAEGYARNYLLPQRLATQATEANIKSIADEKAKRGERVSTFMNYQLNVEMEEWREEHDKLLYDLPYTGAVFKKIFFDPLLGRNVSNLVVYPNFIVNNDVSSIERLRRFSEPFKLVQNEVIEGRARQGSRIHRAIWLV